MLRFLQQGPPPKGVENHPPNSNQHQTTSGMTTTLLISFIGFLCIQGIFEYNRYYKQIYLKRLQKRFMSVGRVPPEPPKHILGWLYEIMKVSELDVLRLVGLDAYMFLRFQTICYKLSLFICFWGLLILVPVYSTAAGQQEWAKFTLSNVGSAEGPDRARLWFAAVFGYVFSAYFCQLLYAEYNNFSVRRLQFLVQANPDSPMSDPDTPQQKYFTIMVERIPAHLRSKAALEKFFDNLFPGEVYNVEVALDLTELNNLSWQRRAVRQKLEKAVAVYEATGQRPIAYVQTLNQTGVNIDILSIDEHETCSSILQKWIDPELFGYDKFDSLNYYTNKLIELNDKMVETQAIYYENAKKSDKALERKIRKRHDTRAAAMVENLQITGQKMFGDNKGGKVGFDALLFGPPPQDFKQVVETERLRVEVYQRKDDPNYAKLAAMSTNSNTTTPPISRPHSYARINMNDGEDSSLHRSISGNDFSPATSPHHQGFSNIIDTDTHEIQRGPGNTIPPPGTFKGWSHSRTGPPVPNYTSSTVSAQSGVHSGNVRLEPRVNDQGLTVFNPILQQTEGTSSGIHTGSNQVHIGPSTRTSHTAQNRTHSEVGVEEEEKKDTYDMSSSPTQNPSKLSRSSSSATINTVMNPILTNVINPINEAMAPILPPSEVVEAAQQAATVGVEKAKQVTKKGWLQTRLAGLGAFKGFLEVERAFEMLTFGAYYKYSTTAFVTFNSRITESICHQMMLSHDAMEISHAPNPKDVIWENVAIPKSQVMMRNFIVNVGLSVGSLFWSSLVNWVNEIGRGLGFSPFVQGYFSVIVMLVFLLILPFIFDTIARYYEGMKLESEIQNSIMTRYFYYQLVNIYVTVGFGVDDTITQLMNILANPHILIEILGKTVPAVSLYFTSLVIVKIFIAVPLEMIRPWQLSTILFMSNFLDRRKCTHRDLRQGAFYSWPMLYGWVYPQLMMVLMIQVTYACIAPFLMPLCSLFFVFAYVMYKYQLLYVYINTDQSGGFMWYAVFNRCLIALLFAVFTLMGYLALELSQTVYAGAFFFLCPLPFCIMYFWSYCDAKFKKQSMNLSLTFAKELDHRNQERKAAGKPTPQDSFRRDLYRQPSLTERPIFPEPYRMDDDEYNDIFFQQQTIRKESGYISNPSSPSKEKSSTFNIIERQNNAKLDIRNSQFRKRSGSMSLDIHEHIDEDEIDNNVCKLYFHQVVIPLANNEEVLDAPLSTARSIAHVSPRDHIRRVSVSRPSSLHSNPNKSEGHHHHHQDDVENQLTLDSPITFTTTTNTNRNNNTTSTTYTNTTHTNTTSSLHPTYSNTHTNTANDSTDDIIGIRYNVSNHQINFGTASSSSPIDEDIVKL